MLPNRTTHHIWDFQSIYGSLRRSGDVNKFTYTAQEMKFSVKDFLIKCDQIRSFLRIWSYLIKKSLMENFVFCGVLGEPVWTHIIQSEGTISFWYGLEVNQFSIIIDPSMWCILDETSVSEACKLLKYLTCWCVNVISYHFF